MTHQPTKATDFSEWYRHVVYDLDLLRNYDVSGCYVMMPKAYKMWEQIQTHLDTRFKERGVSNVYLPMLISEHNLSRETNHLQGFTPEVAWVTRAGDSDLHTRLAIRPTSECAFYPTFAEVIKSHNDLPLKWNQWCSVVRWEFNDPTPFIRSREFLWNEGHCAFSSADEADQNAREMLEVYRRLYEEVLLIPVVAGVKTVGERFAGADATYTIETFVPDARRAIQCATSHFLGQNFSRIFNIRFQTTDADGHTEHAWQTSWGLTTRSIGAMIMVHGDDKGLVLPSKIADKQIVIVPIPKKNNQEVVDAYCRRLLAHYSGLGFRVHYDTADRRPGWKYNYWEERGIPLRFEVGERDVGADTVVVYRRDLGTKSTRPAFMASGDVDSLLRDYDATLLARAGDRLRGVSTYVTHVDEISRFQASDDHRLYFGNLCETPECEATVKGVKIKPMCRPLDQQDFVERAGVRYTATCVSCGGEARSICLFGRSF